VKAEKASSPSRGRHIAGVLVPLLLTLAVVLAAIEVGFRVFYPLIPLEVCASDPILTHYYCQPYLVYDKPLRVGYRYKPGYKVEGWWDPARPTLGYLEQEVEPSDRSDAFWFTLQVDEMGFPNDTPEWPDLADLVIVGDSFVIRTAPKSWIELLEEQTGQDAVVLGAPSWSTLNEIAAVEDYALDLDPKWVVLMYFEGNDLFNTAQYIERRASGLSWREYDFRDVPLYRRSLAWHMGKYWLGKLGARLAPGPEAAPRYRYPVTASTEAGEISLVFKDIQLLPMSADYETLARSDEFAAIKAGLIELDRRLADQGARLLVVYVPSKEHVYWSRIWDSEDVNAVLERTVTVTLSEGDHGALQWEPRYLDWETFNANHNAQERLFEDMARETGIEFLNLTPIFWSEAIRRGELFNYMDLHWNQAGNQLAADVIEEYLGGR
jgi:hypothetical protein